MVATSRLLQQWVVEIQWHTRCHKTDVYHYTTQNKTLRYTNYDGMYLQLAIIYNLFLLISSGLVFQIFICCTLQFLKNHSTNTLSTTSLRKANKEPLQTSTQKKNFNHQPPCFSYYFLILSLCSTTAPSQTFPTKKIIPQKKVGKNLRRWKTSEKPMRFKSPRKYLAWLSQKVEG